MRCVGIDIGAVKLHAVALGGDPEPREFSDIGALAAWAAGADAIAIDAPSGLSTLPHADDAGLSPKFRAARCGEVALGREHGYWVPWVAPSEPPDRGWMRTGLDVYAALAGPPLLEAYPYAGFRELAGGARLARKQTRAGREQRAALLPWAAADWSHDALDAALCAVVAADHAAGRARRVTCGHDDSAIWLPAAGR
jgi:predicted nuclease with RNAse H fold